MPIIGNFTENRRLALAFETKTNGGKLLVCSIDLKTLSDERLVSKQLLISVLNYMNSPSFNPQSEIDPKQIKGLSSDK
jgi:hypothetical protein